MVRVTTLVAVCVAVCVALPADATVVTDVDTVSHSLCYEAHLPEHPKCKGYKEAGYTCKGEYCSAENPSGHPGICATEHKYSVVDPKTGRCVTDASLVPKPDAVEKDEAKVTSDKEGLKADEAALKKDEAKAGSHGKGSKGKNGTKDPFL